MNYYLNRWFKYDWLDTLYYFLKLLSIICVFFSLSSPLSAVTMSNISGNQYKCVIKAPKSQTIYPRLFKFIRVESISTIKYSSNNAPIAITFPVRLFPENQNYIDINSANQNYILVHTDKKTWTERTFTFNYKFKKIKSGRSTYRKGEMTVTINNFDQISMKITQNAVPSGRDGNSNFNSTTYFGSCAISKFPLIKEKKQKIISNIENAFNDFDANGRINIHKALTDLKFYNSGIDGSYGPGTETAIRKYLIFKNIKPRVINVDLKSSSYERNPGFSLMTNNQICKLATNLQANVSVFFKTTHISRGNHVKEAKARGLDCGTGTNIELKQVILALKKLIAEQVQSDELALIKSELSSKDAMLAAQLIVKDVEEFLKSGSGSFDLEFAKKYSAIRKVGKGSWNSNLENKFAEFKSYVFVNEDFQKYSKNQKTKRELEFNTTLENNRQQLTDITETLKTWLQANLIHDKADDVYDQVAAGEKTLEGNDLQEIQQTIITANKFGNALNLTQETLSIGNTQKAEMQINEAVYNSFDATGKMSIQKALTDLGIFKLAIDGVFGPGINIAMTAYLNTNGMMEINDQTAVAKQFKVLVATTFESNLLSLGKSNMSAEEEWLAAIIIMKDIESFLSDKVGSFGLDFIQKYGLARSLSKTFWSDKKKADFLKLKEYVLANDKFRNYAIEQQKEREQSLLDEISSLKEKITEHLGLLKLWLEANLIDERAGDIYKTASDIERSLDENSLNDLSKLLEVTTRTIKDLNLINNVTSEVKIDSKYELNAIYLFVNLTGNASNIFENIDGILELETGSAEVCQVGQFNKRWDEFVTYQKLTQLVDLETMSVRTNCTQSEDFYIIMGKALASGTLPEAVSDMNLDELYVLKKEEIVNLKRRFQYKSESIYEDVFDGAKQGYGLFHVLQDSANICSPEVDNLEAHINLFNGKNEIKIIRYFAPMIINEIEFGLTLNQIHKRLQKKTCSVVYGSSDDLKTLLTAAINANKYKVEFLPIWFSNGRVNEAIQVQKNLQQLDNSKEQDAEQQRILKEEKLNKLRETAANKQRQLRALNDVKFTSIIDRLQVGVREITNDVFEDQANDNAAKSNYELNEELLELIEPIQFDLLDKKLEGWEPTSTTIRKIDFGTVIFNNRKPEAIVVELEINMKNRKIGQFDPYCKRIHIAYDLDFDMWRREIFSNCATETRTNRWKLKNDFESGWVIKVE